jgi:hypothetical protein
MIAAWVGLTLTLALAPPEALPVGQLLGPEPEPKGTAELTIRKGIQPRPYNWGMIPEGQTPTVIWQTQPALDPEAPPEMGIGKTRIDGQYLAAWQVLRGMSKPSRQPDIIALVALDLQELVALAERHLTTPEPRPDPIGSALRQMAEQARALEQELNPNRTRTR